MKHAARVVLLCALCAVSSIRAAYTLPDYPDRPIRFIAPFVPGGPSDILSRLLSQRLTEAWGQPVIVDNRGSAGGIVGFEIAATAPPEVKERFGSQGLDAVGSAPEELARLIKRESVMYAKLIKQVGLKPL